MLDLQGSYRENNKTNKSSRKEHVDFVCAFSLMHSSISIIAYSNFSNKGNYAVAEILIRGRSPSTKVNKHLDALF